MRRLSVLLLVPFLLIGAACGDDDDSGGSVNAAVGGDGGGGFCGKAENLDAEIKGLEQSFTGSAFPSGDTFKNAASSIRDLGDDAPSEIKDDLNTIADGVEQLGEALGDIDLSDTAALSDPANAEKLQQISEDMEDVGGEIEAASNRVAKYLADECGIDIDDGDDVTTTTG